MGQSAVDGAFAFFVLCGDGCIAGAGDRGGLPAVLGVE